MKEYKKPVCELVEFLTSDILCESDEVIEF